MRPVNDAAARIVLVLAFYDDALAGGERDRAGEIGVRFDAHDDAAARREPQEKTLVRTDPSLLHAQEHALRCRPQRLRLRDWPPPKAVQTAPSSGDCVAEQAASAPAAAAAAKSLSAAISVESIKTVGDDVAPDRVGY